MVFHVMFIIFIFLQFGDRVTKLESGQARKDALMKLENVESVIKSTMATVLETFVGDLNQKINSCLTENLTHELEEVYNLIEKWSKESELEVSMENIALVHEKVASHKKLASRILLETVHFILLFFVCYQI